MYVLAAFAEEGGIFQMHIFLTMLKDFTIESIMKTI